MKNYVRNPKIVILVLVCNYIYSYSEILAQCLLQGKVLDPRQNPIQYATIYLEPKLQTVFSDSTGHYIFSKLEKGEYKVWVTRLGYLKIEKNIKINTDT
ncbi:MAG: carboxypeptidase-like regulatory domain-containing protein, partial [Bacteroidia bacterium]|nr:carboxypeptidase-like regulatory domain-containing protein [Bacteroidia bacterium]